MTKRCNLRVGERELCGEPTVRVLPNGDTRCAEHRMKTTSTYDDTRDGSYDGSQWG